MPHRRRSRPYIAAGFDNFDITDFPSQAALLSLMLYESGSFKYNINHFPGVPGQGTRNMQSPAFNLQYAQWLATTVTNSNITADQVAQANTAGPAAVLALVDIDPWSFSSAAWFLSTQCSDAVKQELAKGTDNGWNGYLTDCVGTTATDDRTAIWKKAMALGKWEGKESVVVLPTEAGEGESVGIDCDLLRHMLDHFYTGTYEFEVVFEKATGVEHMKDPFSDFWYVIDKSFADVTEYKLRCRGRGCGIRRSRSLKR
ncbi:hypothetical protein H2203_003590 [Taxawa tesnikishii (nom. ined.)]|nr:hypothetical protein H2203_003590 [Dothideales sp. JES 119]